MVKKEKSKDVVKDEVSGRFVVRQYATQTESVIVDSESEDEFDVLSALVKVLNDLDELKRVVL